MDLADNAKPFKIGSWVVAQRKEKAMGRMDPEKVNLLQKLVEEGELLSVSPSIESNSHVCR